MLALTNEYVSKLHIAVYTHYSVININILHENCVIDLNF